MIAFINNLRLDKQKTILIFVVFIIVLIVDMNFIMTLQLKGIKALGLKIANVKRDISNIQKDITNVPKVAVVPKAMFNKKFITDKEIPFILKYISGLAFEKNVRVMQINSTKDTKADKDNVYAVNVKLELVATYHTLGAFINNMENSEYLIQVNELRINRDIADNMKQKVNLTIKVYAKK